MVRRLLFVNIAGGTGKTTSSVNFGAALAERGYRVLVVDMDPQGNASKNIGLGAKGTMAGALVDPKTFDEAIGATGVPNLEVAHGSMETAGAELLLAQKPSSAPTRLRKGLRQLGDRYDYVVIDAPPAPGILTINCIVACDEIIIPVETQPKALDGVANMRELLSSIVGDEDLFPNGAPPATFLATKYDGRTKLDRSCLETLRGADAPYPAFTTVIRRNQRLPEAYAFRLTILQYDPKSPGAQDYRALATEYLNRG